MDIHVRYVEMLSLLGRIAGKSLAEAITEEYETERSLEGLKVALESFLPKFMNFEAILEGEVLRTKSNCPIYKYNKEWCNKGCIPMMESFAKVINPKITVKRIKNEPEDCEFEFSMKT